MRRIVVLSALLASVAFPALCGAEEPVEASEFRNQVRDATPEELQAIKEGLKFTLKDPYSAVVESAKIRSINYCAEINAKNAYGAYTGVRTMSGMIVTTEKGTRAVPDTLGRPGEDYRKCKEAGIY